MDFFGFVRLLCQLLTLAIFIRAILSWFPISPYNRFVVIMYQITEPFLAPLRRVIPRIGMLDITPLVAIVVLQLIARLLP